MSSLGAAMMTRTKPEKGNLTGDKKPWGSTVIGKGEA
jgi:hypothetical protein